MGAVERAPDGRFIQRNEGERCSGNTSCTPICPIQARYNAGKTLAQARSAKLKLVAQAVASRVNIDPTTGAVSSITYQRYDAAGHTVHQARGRVYVLAAHAIENAKLLLASDLGGSKGLVGCHLMDHPALYAWGLAPTPVGPFRGPLSTSGIEELRAGPFRARHAAFRFDIGNDGWRATTGAPDTTVADAVMKQKRFGNELRSHLADQLSRQVRFSLAIEQLPDAANRISVDRRFLDPLGNPRPAIHYRIDEYTLGGMAAATRVYQEIFQRAGITDCSDAQSGGWFPSVQYGASAFHYHGMGHFAGTHLMGSSPSDSVVDATQRSWEHRNLYLVGSGSFPTMGTSNPTLTLSALAIRTAEHLIRELKSGSVGDLA
jgi:choline dehydrogenase-like flavoprotein